jgi:glycosyltransferase involved in cell wall biosynthesis
MRSVYWIACLGVAALFFPFLLLPYYESPQVSRVNDWKVWVVTPCYKQESSILETMHSVLNQKYKSWYLLVVDDGSPDRSCYQRAKEGMRSLGITQAQGKAIYQENAGLVLTRLNGIRYLQRKFPNDNPARTMLCFLDSDDLITPKYFQKAVEYLNQVPDTELVYALQLVIVKRPEGDDPTIWVPVLGVETARKRGPLPVMSLIRADVYERVRGFSAAMVEGNEDHSFWLKCLENGVKAHRLHMPGSHYFAKPNSMMRSAAYQAVAVPMLKLSHVGLFDNDEISDSLFQLYCGLQERQIQRLLPIIELEPQNCNPILWVWFYYIRMNGFESSEAQNFQSKLEICLTTTEDDEDANNPVTRMIYKAFSTFRIEITSTSCKQPQQSPFTDLLEESDPALNLFRVTSLLGSFVSEWRSRSSGSSSFQRAFNFVVITSSTNDKASQKGENTLLRYAARIPSVKTNRITLDGKNELESLETLSFAISSQLNGIDSIDGIYLSLPGKEQAITSILLSQNILQKVGFIVTDFNKTVLDLSGPLPATEYIVRSFGDIGVTTVSGGRGERFMHDGLLSSHLANSEPMQLIMRSTTYFPATEQGNSESRFNRKKKPTVIPCIVHFVFGMSDDEKDRFFNMQQYLAVKAAHDFLQPETIYVHYTYDPLGSWWELAKDFVTPNKVRNVMNIFNHSVHHFAHKADIIRLEVLMQYGGIYLDLDVWVYRDLRFLLTSGHEFIMGQEGENGAVGLCNAIIIADKESRFLKHWYNAYRNFSADSWNEFSVQLPNRLAAELPAWIHVLPHTAFFWPMWDSNGLTRLYLSQDCPWFQMGYAVHLWSSKARSMIDELGTQSLYQYDSCFFQLARKIYYGNGDRKQQLSSSSLFLKGSHDLGEETSNQRKGTEMSEIVIGVLVFSLEELETVRNSWMTAALEFGIHCYFYTSSVSLAEEYSALIKMRKSRDEVPLTVLKPQFAPSPDPTSREWVSSHMLAHLFDNNKGKGMKWFVKVEADTFLRPDALRNTLSQYDSNEPTYLGSVTEFHGHRQTSDQMKTGEYIRLRYAQGHFYAMSSSAMKGIRPKLIECISDLWKEDKALAHCLRKYLDLQPSDVSSSSVPIHVIPVSDRFHQLAYHGMDGLAMVGLARTLYGSHSVVVPALSEAGYQEMNHFDTENTKVKSVSFLSDPNDFRRHDVLYNRGAVLSYWQDQCFASGEVCGWKEITRTDCLAIGCCYKDEFSALFSPCMKAEGGTFQTENQLRATMITTTTAAVASSESRTVTPSTLVGESICAKHRFVLVSSREALTSVEEVSHPLEYILQMYLSHEVSRFLSCDAQLAKCIFFQTIRKQNQCTELLVTKDQSCLDSVAVSTACKMESLPERVMNVTTSMERAGERAYAGGRGGFSEITSAITEAFRKSVFISSAHDIYGKNMDTIADRLIRFFKRKLEIDASSLRSLSSISVSRRSWFTFLLNHKKKRPMVNNEFEVHCEMYNPYLTEPGLLLCTFGVKNSLFPEIPAPKRFQHQLSH